MLQEHIDRLQPRYPALEAGPERMTELCHSFPVLRGQPGTAPWDQEKFALWAKRVDSTATQQAAAFVLAVWAGNSNEAIWIKGKFGVGRFDVVLAMSVWDCQQKAAFAAWCNFPFWP